MKRLVIDLDGTLTEKETSCYDGIGINAAVAERVREYHAAGFEIVVYTARNMRTHNSSLGRITAKTVPSILDWLARYEIPYDELWVGKPWCGREGFYVDDKAVRPDEFASLSYEEIRALLGVGPNDDTNLP